MLPAPRAEKRLATSPQRRLSTEQLLRTLDLSHLLARRLDGTTLYAGNRTALRLVAGRNGRKV
jgi:hypothetical protein